jgi:succinyl-diaminopimelate desuccinylase
VREFKGQPGTIEPEHGRVQGAVIDTLQTAREDYDALVKLTRDLARVPSRGGIDPLRAGTECMAAWLTEHGLSCRRLARPGGATVALTCEVPGGRLGPRFVLDACLDTAPFGDEAAWTYPRHRDR